MCEAWQAVQGVFPFENFEVCQRRRATQRIAGVTMAVEERALLGFVAAADGAARPITIVSSLAMVGMPVAAAASALLLHKKRAPSAVWLIAAQALHVIVSGRVASRLQDPGLALVVALVSALVTGGLLPWGVRPPKRQRRIPEMKVLR